MASKPILVFVPGAFHRPSSWNAVTEPLRKEGYTVLMPALTVCRDLHSATAESAEWKDLAAKGVPEDAQAIRDVLLPELDKGNTAILVSHSYGSIPASFVVQDQTVAERAARGLPGGIVSFVAVAGVAYPVRGKGIMGDNSEPPILPYHILDNGILHLQKDCVPLWYSDLTPEAQEAAWADLIKTQSRQSFLLFPDFLASDIKIPKTWVLTEEDQAVLPQYQAAFIQAGQFENVIKIKSGHVPMLNMPEKIVEIIRQVASA
ncbi:uncharacterized protein SPSK_10789 [Sporothrix schenckii 1099-18]|uniref:AB hydrolase-1 domain-containing protein n=1 Tax=Sporothrix schenckii 1099-18 TaxID=1397361 RepID=A0A0F2MIB8_SPOSC|nr:uncharacterized protein SPSK_10789 [Sporothrix schenckii 1099-18]KJR88580.1 hypothetical protein SPSK_10789 [Sporothrix schenckii 1099-18]